jgi:hypothetical protein
MQPMDDEEIVQWRQALVEPELFEFVSQLSIQSEEEELEEEEQMQRDEEQHDVEVTPDPKSRTIHFHPDRSDEPAFRARVALDWIADFVSALKAELRPPKSGDEKSYVWLASDLIGWHPDSTFHLLCQTVANRPRSCSEPPNERTLGQQRRFLAPQRMRMTPEMLFARIGLEESEHKRKIRRPN